MPVNEYKQKQRQERNERIRKYRQTHPGASIRTIGKLFRIDHSQVSRILNTSVAGTENNS